MLKERARALTGLVFGIDLALTALAFYLAWWTRAETTAVESGVATTSVTFGELSGRWIDWYVGTPEPYDKAGGYGVQGAAGLFVTHLEGSPTNVVGLPLDLVARLVARTGHDLLDFLRI